MVGETTIEAVVGPVFHVYVVAPLAVSVALPPAQIVELAGVTVSTGAAVIVIVFTIGALLPPPLDAINVIEYTPAAAYVTNGLCNVDVEGAPPVIVYDHAPGLPVDISIIETVCPTQAGFGLKEKLATGGGTEHKP